MNAEKERMRRVQGGAKGKFLAVVLVALVIAGVLIIRDYSQNRFAAEEVRAERAPVENGVQIVHMTQNAGGYFPNRFIVKRNVPVRWIIAGENPFTCTAQLMVKDYDILKLLEKGENVIEFTPERTGTFAFGCSGELYSGSFTVID